MPKVSFVVPVYKVEDYLARCVDSILKQSFRDFEVILVDDGSPDNCGTICDDYAEKDDRVRVVHQKNSKSAAARNTGIDIAQGEWLALVDADDWIHKDYLKILLSGVQDDTDVVLCDCMITGSNLEEDHEAEDAEFKNVTFAEIEANHVANTRVWARLYKRETVGSVRFISGAEPVDDACFNVFLLERSMHFRLTDAKLYYYYMREGSAISDHMGRAASRSVEPIVNALSTVSDPEKRARIIVRCYKTVFFARYLEMFSSDYKTIEGKCRELLNLLKPYRKELTYKKRIIYGALAEYPILYRIWRVYNDPSLLKYERNQKQLRNTQTCK